MAKSTFEIIMINKQWIMHYILKILGKFHPLQHMSFQVSLYLKQLQRGKFKKLILKNLG